MAHLQAVWRTATPRSHSQKPEVPCRATICQTRNQANQRKVWKEASQGIRKERWAIGRALAEQGWSCPKTRGPLAPEQPSVARQALHCSPSGRRLPLLSRSRSTSTRSEAAGSVSSAALRAAPPPPRPLPFRICPCQSMRATSRALWRCIYPLLFSTIMLAPASFELFLPLFPDFSQPFLPPGDVAPHVIVSSRMSTKSGETAAVRCLHASETLTRSATSRPLHL